MAKENFDQKKGLQMQMEAECFPETQGQADGRGPGLSVLVHAAFRGMAEGGASRQVVAAAIAALLRTRTGEGCADDGSDELAQRVRDLKLEMKTRDAVGELAGRVFSHTKPAREFLTGVNQQLGLEYTQQVQRRNLAAHPGEKRAGRKRRSSVHVAVKGDQNNEKAKLDSFDKAGTSSSEPEEKAQRADEGTKVLPVKDVGVPLGQRTGIDRNEVQATAAIVSTSCRGETDKSNAGQHSNLAGKCGQEKHDCKGELSVLSMHLCETNTSPKHIQTLESQIDYATEQKPGAMGKEDRILRDHDALLTHIMTLEDQLRDAQEQLMAIVADGAG